jgi:2-phospho-L-lactate guanylyltransferase
MGPMGWCALVPQKALARAKGRVELPVDERKALAVAMLRDTLAAICVTTGVRRVAVLWDDVADRVHVPDVDAVSVKGLGLNASLERGVTWARRWFPHLDVVVVPGDLPALDPLELEVCLARAGDHSRAFLPDARGDGTTLLTATGDVPLVPRYGAGSAGAHEATGASPLALTGVESARSDVDDLESLARAMSIGCGHHTLGCCASLGLTPLAVR